MDKVQLRHFVLLAKTLNFSAVAKQEYISQPALTKQISRLEEELGVRLFHRTKHSVSLTSEGEAFYTHAVEILNGIERAERHMERLRLGRTGSLTVSTIYGLNEAVSECVGRFIERYPAINVEIVTGTGAQQMRAIDGRTADVFFSYAPFLSLFPGVEYISLPPDRFAIYVCARDAERIRQEGLSCLDGMTQLLEYRTEGGPLFTDMILSMRKAIGLRSSRLAYYSSNATILIAVQAGMGFAFLPMQMSFGKCPDNVERFPLDVPEAIIDRALGWYRSSTNIAAGQFADVIREMFPPPGAGG